MTCVIVAVVAFLAGCEWMILMHRRAKRRLLHIDGSES
jgi:hypothetical protein